MSQFLIGTVNYGSAYYSARFKGLSQFLIGTVNNRFLGQKYDILKIIVPKTSKKSVNLFLQKSETSHKIRISEIIEIPLEVVRLFDHFFIVFVN